MELQSVMTKVFALVNTSISEGMASSILEVMSVLYDLKSFIIIV